VSSCEFPPHSRDLRRCSLGLSRTRIFKIFPEVCRLHDVPVVPGKHHPIVDYVHNDVLLAAEDDEDSVKDNV
jgi:hypothetical protein